MMRCARGGSVGRADGGFAALEESLNRIRVIRFLEGRVILFVELVSISDVLDNLE